MDSVQALSLSGGPAAANHTIFKHGELRVLDFCAGGATVIHASGVEGMLKQPAAVGYLGFFVKHLDVSGTAIRDQDLRYITTVSCTAPTFLSGARLAAVDVYGVECLWTGFANASATEPDPGDVVWLCACR